MSDALVSRLGDEGHCEGCGHALARHYLAIDGTVRCLVVHSGHSTSGVIGLPWSSECDCVDRRSVAAVRRAEHEAHEEAERREWIDDFRASLATSEIPPLNLSPHRP